MDGPFRAVSEFLVRFLSPVAYGTAGVTLYMGVQQVLGGTFTLDTLALFLMTVLFALIGARDSNSNSTYHREEEGGREEPRP